MTRPVEHRTQIVFQPTIFISLVLMLVIGFLALILSITNTYSPPYTPDSASYIDQARSLLSGNGFQARPWGIEPIDVSQEPDKLFPPGYPILIAAVSDISGAPMEIIAPWINRIALMLLPLFIFLAFRSVIGIYGAVCLGILGGLSPGVINNGQSALTDVLSLTLVVITFGFTLAAFSHQSQSRSLLLAFCGGLVGGYAYLTRNAHLALLIAVPLSIGIWFLISSNKDRDRAWRIGLSWVLGASLVVMPWLVRNVIIFGKVQPYQMNPSTVSAWINLRGFIDAQISEILGSPDFGRYVGWSMLGLIALLVIAIIIIWLLYKQWTILQNKEQRAVIFSLTYALLGSVVVIAARTKYQWGESISDRHTLQYAVFFILPLIIMFRHIPARRATMVTLFAGIMIALISMRLWSIPETKHRNNLYVSSIYALINKARFEQGSSCYFRHNIIVVSNYAFLYRIICNSNARHLDDNSFDGKSIPETIAIVRSRVMNRPVIVALHPDLGIKPSNLPLRNDQIKSLEAEGWVMLENTPLTLELTRN